VLGVSLDTLMEREEEEGEEEAEEMETLSAVQSITAATTTATTTCLGKGYILQFITDIKGTFSPD
jgi:hypothetical protein